MNLNGVAQGYLNYEQANQERQVQQQEMQMRALQMEAMRQQTQQQAAARQATLDGTGAVRQAMAPPPPPPPQPPMPGQASMPMQPPQAMSPQASQMMQQGTGAPVPPQPQRPPIPPYQTVPQGQAPATPPPQQMAPPPLGQQPQQPQGQQQQPDPASMLRRMAADPSVSNEAFLAAQEQMKPLIAMQQQDLAIQREARAAAQTTYQNILAERRLAQQDSRLDEQSRHDRSMEDRQTRALDEKGQTKPKMSVIRDDKGMRYTQTVNPDGSITMKDAKGREVDPETVHPAGSAGQETMRNAVKLDITELDYALDKIKGLDVKTASPWFADKGDKGAMRRFFNNDLTPTEMQRYDVFANRIAPAIASLQTMGRGQISDAKVAAAAKLIPQPGDDDATVNDKLSAIKALRDRANAVQQGKSPDSIKEGTDTPAPAAAGPYSDADKEARYQAWKAKNAGQ
jgi:hypothetical protein